MRDRGLDVLEDAEEECCAPRVPDEDGSLVDHVALQHRGKERLDRLTVETRIVRDLDNVAARFQPGSQPSVPAVVRMASRSVEDDRARIHRGTRRDRTERPASGDDRLAHYRP